MKNQFKIVLLILLVGGIISCNTSKRLEKKSEKIAQKAMIDTRAFQIVGSKFIELNPCPPTKDSIVYGKPDTLITVIPGNNDSLNNIIDSLLTKECPTLNVDSLRSVIKKQTKPVTIYKDVVKTDTLYRPDQRIQKMQSDTINYYKGQNYTLNQTITTIERSNSKKTWWIVGISFAALLIIGGLIFAFFKK